MRDTGHAPQGIECGSAVSVYRSRQTSQYASAVMVNIACCVYQLAFTKGTGEFD
jgi:hypothetical protein